ncbi:MAG TPA: nucleotidyltransferase family protein [Nevskiaceae bacterium]|nr:nucleotidyltransferase family protein [Nevskiaceae bacterium]
MKAMVLAAGRGERMRPLTDTIPKPLVPLAGRPLIEHAIGRLAQAGVTELVVNLGYRGEQLRAHLGDGSRLGVRIAYSDEGDPPLDTGGGVFRALDLLGDDPFLVVNSDIYSRFDLAPLAARAAAMPARDLAHLVLVPNPAERPNGDFALVDDGRVLNDGALRLTYAGLSILKPELFWNCEDGRFSLVPLWRHAAACGQLGGERYDGLWSDVGTPERLASLETRLQESP